MGQRSDEYREIRKNLNQLRDEVIQNEAQLHRLLPKLIAENIKDALEAESILQIEQPKGLNRIAYRDFLCYEKSADDIGLSSTPIALHGSGPWDCEDFQVFLESKGFEFVSINEAKNFLVLGELQCEEESINNFISNAISDNFLPRIYTQEMLIYYLITGEDPIESWSKTTLLDSVEGHSGMGVVLAYTDLFWPDKATLVDEDYGVSEIDASDWSDESPLKKLGYTVRDGVLSDRQRHEILNNVFKNSLDHLLTTDLERERWGKAESAQRLYAIVSFIHWLAEFQGNQKPLAYEKWQTDLSWLKSQFFDKRMQFKWPMYSKKNMATNKIKDFSAKSRRKLTPLYFSQLRIGNRVYHQNFGWGEVLRTYFVHQAPRAEIKFDQPSRTRVIDMKIAKLFS